MELLAIVLATAGAFWCGFRYRELSDIVSKLKALKTAQDKPEEPKSALLDIEQVEAEYWADQERKRKLLNPDD